jgi:hypothetical protein
MNVTRKPIKKCNGCPLNFKRNCGVYEIPRQMWERGTCPGYNNEELLMNYRIAQENIAAKEEARRRRREIQALRKTEPHHAGHQYALVSADKASDSKKSGLLHGNYVATGKHSAKIDGAASLLVSRFPRITVPRASKAYR